MRHASFRMGGRAHIGRGARYAYGGISCVPFARAESGIEIAGNAGTWWAHAAGAYERGNRPEPGSVLAFRAVGAMRLGHVSVVSNVINSRTIEIDHANWAGPGAMRGGVSRGVRVVDVSEANDWTAIRVSLGRADNFGSIYPTYGFIYNRPDRGVMVASAGQDASSAPSMNPAPRDLRPVSARFDTGSEEVAELPDDSSSAPTFHHAVAHRGGKAHARVHHHIRD